MNRSVAVVGALLLACSGDDGAGDPLSSFAGASSGPVYGTAEGGVVRTVAGRFAVGPGDFVEQHAAAFGVEDVESELIERARGGQGAATWVSYARVFEGVPVASARLRVHSLNGEVVFASAQLPPEVAVDDVEPTLTAGEAVTRFSAARGLDPDAPIGDAELVIFHPALFEADGRAALAWRVASEDYAQDGPTGFVDAHTGEVLHSVPTTATARDRVVRHYVGDDVLCQPDCNAQEAVDAASELWFDEAGQLVDAEPSAAGARAFELLGDLYDYFAQVHGRDGWDGLGGPLTLLLDHPMETLPHDIAYLPGIPAILAREAWVSRTAIGHEYAHGVVMSATGLAVDGGPGALNEALADVLSVLAEDHVVDADWTIREADGTLVRDLKDPEIEQVGSATLLDSTHARSGPFSLALWMIATGNPHPKNDTEAIEAMTKRELEQVLNAAIERYIQPRMGLEAGAHALVQACLVFAEQGTHGYEWSDCGSMMNAFHSVGLGVPDRDLDAIPDAVDNCRDDANHDQDPRACLPQDCKDAISHFCSRIQGQGCDTSDMGPAIGRITGSCGGRVPGGFASRAEAYCSSGGFTVSGCAALVAGATPP